jgi:hypothetical protein
VVEVASPRQKLEDLFLRIVEDAQARRLATGGAVAGGKVAAFLREGGSDAEPSGREVIEHLVAAAGSDGRDAPAPGVAQPVAEAPSPAPPATEVIEELVAAARPNGPDGAGGPLPAAQGRAAGGPGDAAPPADRSVIDDLLDKDGKRRKDA